MENINTQKPKIRIIRIGYGISKELQEMIDNMFISISEEYNASHPNLGIDKERLYRAISGAEYYKKEPIIVIVDGEERKEFEGGYFDIENRKLYINTYQNNEILDDHTFIHEITHSFLSIREMFGGLLDEGLVDIQASQVDKKKSNAYPNERMLAKMLSTIIGEDELLEYATKEKNDGPLGPYRDLAYAYTLDDEKIMKYENKEETDNPFEEYKDIIHMLRIKGTIADGMKDDNPLRKKILFSMVDDLKKLFERKYGVLKDRENAIKSIQQELGEFSRNENKDILNCADELLQYFLDGIAKGREENGQKVEESKPEKVDKLYEKLAKLQYRKDTILWCYKSDYTEEGKEIYVLKESFYFNTIGNSYTRFSIDEGTNILIYDTNSGEWSVDNSIKDDVISFQQSNSFSESLTNNSLFKKAGTSTTDIGRVKDEIAANHARPMAEEINKKTREVEK